MLSLICTEMYASIISSLPPDSRFHLHQLFDTTSTKYNVTVLRVVTGIHLNTHQTELAPCGTDGRLFTNDISAKSKVT